VSRILLTGANGYLGKRLLPVLLEKGHHVFISVRDKNTVIYPEEYKDQIELFEADFLKAETLQSLPTDFDFTYFLMHSLSSSGEFKEKEMAIAENFVSFIDGTTARQIVYLGGISNAESLSPHLESRLATENYLSKSKIPLTVIRAAIIIGSGSASFEIIRDLVEKLPVMIAPRWLNTRCQPIGVRNIIHYLAEILGKEGSFGKIYDVGGPDILTYKQMLLKFASVRKVRRWIIPVPVMTPRLSSYWLFFVTSTSYRIAVNLVESMKNEVIAEKGNIKELIQQDLLTFEESVALAFSKIAQNLVTSSWKDNLLESGASGSLGQYIQVPEYGTFSDIQKKNFHEDKLEQVLDNLWAIGGERGWYYGNWLWKIRGYLDKMAGGAGLRRGRRSPTELHIDDSLDFWRVLLADRQQKRLLLYAEMKMPGEAWLEFAIHLLDGKKYCLIQTATFRPVGLLGRLYWYSVLPFHWFIFRNMLTNVVTYENN
jgi:uncharacterized protein YbjT (DUF2867 family)